MNLSTLPLLDSLRSSAGAVGSVTRIGNVDVISPGGIDATQEDAIALCHIPLILPFTIDEKKQLYSFETAAAVALAAHHLNSGDGSVVPEVKGLDKRCNVRFSTDAYDTQYRERVGVDKVIDLLVNRRGGFTRP